ncbi:MAG: DUF4920 domain-containing protein [Saprospiraceae bacterium]
MRILLPLLFAIALCGVACQTPSSTATTAGDIDAATPAATGVELFGAEEDFSAPLPYPALVKQISAAPADTMEVNVAGKVNSVCKMKGCWMTIVDESTDAEMMVKFKDYGFFMPMDIDGREVVMHGKAYYQTTPVDELRHYAEDAGKSAEEIAAITEPERELRFLASGVQLLPNN